MSKNKTLILVVALFLISRLAVLFSSIGEVYNSEDLAMGVVAKEAIKGMNLPLFEYPYLTYSGGTLVVGLMAVPFFLLLGPNYFALKLVPLLFSAATLIILFLFAYKFFNRRVALITAVLYIFSSFSWCGFNFYLGFHTESLFFCFLALLIFYEIIFNNKDKPFYYLGLGLVCGFGVYFSYTFLVTQAAIAIVWLIHERRLWLKNQFYIYILGFMIGMIPWLFYNLTCQFKGVTDVLPQFWEGKGYFDFKTWLNLIWNFLRSLWFAYIFRVDYLENGFFRFYRVMYAGAYWFSFAYLFWRNRPPVSKLLYSRDLLVLIFPLLLLMSVRFYSEGAENTYLTEGRYLVGLFPIVFLTVAIMADRLFSRSRMLKAGLTSVFLVLLVLSGIGYIRKVNPGDFGSGFRQPGYSYLYLSETFNYKYPADFYKILDNMTRLSVPQRYETMTLRLVIDLANEIRPVDFKEYLRLSQRLEKRYWPYFYKILLWGLYYNSELPFRDLALEVDKLSENVGQPYRPYFYEGLGAAVVKRYSEDMLKARDGVNFMNIGYVPAYYRGLSASIYLDDIPSYLVRCKNVLGWIEDRYKPFYLEGMGEVMAKFAVTTFMVGLSYDDKGLRELYEFFDNMDPQYKIFILRGAGKSLSYFYDPNTEQDVYRFVNYFKGRDRQIILKAMADNLK